MRGLFTFLGLVMYCSIKCVAQVVVNPVFDRADVLSFRVEKVEITSDTTYVYCQYHADDNSWANISSDTYIEDVSNGFTYSILKVFGIPFSPDKRHFKDPETIQVVLLFPHISTDTFNIIESQDNESFNIYGIDLKNSYDTIYTENDVNSYRYFAELKEKENDWKAVIEYTLKQLEAARYVHGIRSDNTSWAMYNLTLYYFEKKDYDKVIEWGKNAIEILSELPQDSVTLDVLARSYENVSTAYHLKNQHEIAMQYMELSLATRRLGNGIGIINYDKYLRQMATLYYYNGNYPKALLYGKESAQIYERRFKEDNRYGCLYINSLSNLCEYYQKMEQYEEAVRVGENALELVNNGVCESYRYAVYHNLAHALYAMGQKDEGITYIEKIKNEQKDDKASDNRETLNYKMAWANVLLERKYDADTIKAINEYETILKTLENNMAIGKNNFIEYTTVLEKLYSAYIVKDKNIGMNYLKKLIEVQKEWSGGESIAYAECLREYILNTYAEVIYEQKSTDTLYHYLKTFFDITKQHFSNSIYNMSKTERSNYWERYKYIYTWLIPTISSLLQTDKWNSLAYDASLFYKGVLLSSEIEFKNVIQASNDTMQSLYAEYVRTLSLLERQYSSNNNPLDVDSLKSEIKEKEFLLSQMASRFNKHYKGTNFSWREVKDKLNEDDVAIEIVAYRSADNSTLYYDAYVIESTSTAPKQIYLFDEEILQKLLRPDSTNYEKMSNLIWGNKILNKIIEGKRNIYFSTSGSLNIIGIEYLPITKDLNICDKYNLYRLSSTRMLCMEKDSMSIVNACLYGGLDYNHAEESSPYVSKVANHLSRSLVDSLISRGDFDPLIGSKQEIEQVKLEMENKSLNCAVYMGADGTESSFKMMSGSPINIIHLATHGMYCPYESDDVVEKNNFSFIMSDEISHIDEEDKSLLRSFLVMSGGNSLIHREGIPIEAEDGILTALEISHLDFSNLDLVVLSACQTALGVIDYEGVYGLQRGFKKAGANTILMSLDKVDDEATKILMVEFYKNLMSGKGKHQSFKNAQKYLREVDNGKYNKPEYWASFIMLDGLN